MAALMKVIDESKAETKPDNGGALRPITTLLSVTQRSAPDQYKFSDARHISRVDKLNALIVKQLLPLHIVESTPFKEYSAILDPKFKVCQSLLTFFKPLCLLLCQSVRVTWHKLSALNHES